MSPKKADKALRDMHRMLYPEQYNGRGQRLPRERYSDDVYQWDAGTIEDIARLLNDHLGNDGEGRAAA